MTRRPAHALGHALTGLLLLLASTLLGVSPASAHAGLTGSDPQDGARLDAVPSSVSFTFSEDIQQPAYVVVTAAGTRVAEGEAAVDANTVTAEVAADAPAGRWTAAYRVVSTDGHAVTGEIGFQVAAPAEEPTDTATGSATDTATAGPDAEPSTTSGESTAAPARSADDSGLWPPHTEHVVLGAVLLAAAAGALVWARRRAR